MSFHIYLNGSERTFERTMDEAVLRAQLNGIIQGRRVVWFQEVPLKLNIFQSFVWLILAIIPSTRKVVFADLYARRSYQILSDMRNRMDRSHPLYDSCLAAYARLHMRFNPPIIPRTYTWIPAWRPTWRFPTMNFSSAFGRPAYSYPEASFAGAGAGRPARDLSGRAEYRQERREYHEFAPQQYAPGNVASRQAPAYMGRSSMSSSAAAGAGLYRPDRASQGLNSQPSRLTPSFGAGRGGFSGGLRDESRFAGTRR